MVHLAKSMAKALLYASFIYLITLLIFLIDTAGVARQTREFITLTKKGTISKEAINGYSHELNRYSNSLNSILLYPPSLLAGDLNTIPRLGRVLESGSSALAKVSPFFPSELEKVRLTDSQLLSRNITLLRSAQKDISASFQEFSAIKPTGALSIFQPRLNELQNKVDRYQQVFERTAPLLPILPDLLGNYTKRSYFVAMQNSAQARGTGGLIGTFAIVSIDKGSISLDYVAPNSALQIQPDIPIDVPTEYRVIYQDYAKSWNGSNFSPHFPYAAQIWAETWRRMTGQDVDGVISIDTFMLRALLAASGPVDIDGYQINEDNVIEELLSKAYVRFESDPAKRKNFLANVAEKVAERIISGQYSRSILLRKVIDPVLENRVYIYSPYPREAQYLALTPLSGLLDDGANNEYRLVLQNIAGNKLDYYMERELTIMSEQCSPIRTSRVDFAITNTADPKSPLPAYVNALRAQGFPQGNQNTQFAGVFLYGPTDSRITGVIDTDTGKTYGRIFKERSRSLFSVQVMIPAGSSKRFSVFFEGGTGPISTVVQPLVLPQKTIIADSCSS